VVRNEFQAIAAGFDAVPALTLTGGYSVTLVGVGAYSYTLPAAAGTLTTTTDVSTAVAVETTRAQAAEALRATSSSLVSEINRATGAEVALTSAVALLAPKLNPTITGLHETSVVVPAGNIDCNAATFFTRTLTGNSVFTVSNVPASGTVASFVLELTNGAAFTVTWWSGVKWPNGVAPTLTTLGVDVFRFYTTNGGSTWRGFVLGQAMA
jgi:hypothetical protein